MAKQLKKLDFKPVMDVEMHDGTMRSTEDIYVLQVSIGARARLRQVAHDAKNADQMAQADVAAVIEAACDAEGKRLWDKDAKKWLLEQPAGLWLDAIARQAAVMMRGPIGGKCAAPKLDKDGAPVLDKNGKPEVCDFDLVPGEHYCPRCGTQSANEVEIARGN